MKRVVLGSRQPRGIVAVQVAVFAPLLLGFAALTIDVGMLYVVRAELQRTADAAALAGVQDLLVSGVDTAVDMARASALEYVAKNPVLGKYPPVCDPTADIVFGQARLKEAGAASEFWPGVMPPNAVQVTVRYDVPYSFASVFGLTSHTVGATAVAATKARDYVIVIDCSGSMTKQSVEADVAADLADLGIDVASSGGKRKRKKNSAIKTALSLTYDGGDPEFAGVYAIGEAFLPPSVRILPLKPTKDAAAYSISVIDNNGRDDLVGAVAYATDVAWVEPLTTNYARVRAKLRGATKYGGTSLHEGIRAAREELLSDRARAGADKVIVLMTDGKSDPTLALAEAQLAVDQNMFIHCVGLGTDIDYDLLEAIAALGRGVTLYVDNTADPTVYGPALEQVFTTIATKEVRITLIT